MFLMKRMKYNKFQAEQCEKASKQAKDSHINILKEMQRVLLSHSVRRIVPLRLSIGRVAYSPKQLKGVIDDLIDYPNLLVAYMIKYASSPVASDLSLPKTFKEDLIDSFSKVRVLFEDNREKQKKGIEVLANLTYVQEGLGHAKEFYSRIERPYLTGQLDSHLVRYLLVEGFVHPSNVIDNQICGDRKILNGVREEMKRINPELTGIICNGSNGA